MGVSNYCVENNLYLPLPDIINKINKNGFKSLIPKISPFQQNNAIPILSLYVGINDYKFPIMITNSREVYCKELKNIHYKNILKYIQNNDDDNLCKYFELLINDLCETDESLNYIDKFLTIFKT